MRVCINILRILCMYTLIPHLFLTLINSRCTLWIKLTIYIKDDKLLDDSFVSPVIKESLTEKVIFVMTWLKLMTDLIDDRNWQRCATECRCRIQIRKDDIISRSVHEDCRLGLDQRSDNSSILWRFLDQRILWRVSVWCGVYEVWTWTATSEQEQRASELRRDERIYYVVVVVLFVYYSERNV